VTEPNDEARAALDAAALARVLDGLELDLDADDAARDAQERAAADVASIGRAFGVLGEAFAAPAAEPAVDDDTAENNVVALPLWRRRPGRTILAAAASIAVMGLRITVVVANNDDGSNDTNHSATAAGGAAVMQAPAAPAAPAPEAQYRSNAQSATGSAADSASAAAPAAAAPAAAAAGTTAAKSSKAASTKASDDGTGESLEDAVACARGILIGEVVSIKPGSGDLFTVTLKVTDWISPGSGPTQITYTVGDDDADGSGGKLKAGQKRLFVVPRSTSASVYTFTGPDYSLARSKIAKAQNEDKDVQC
jgi:hypothetical protein